MTADTKLSFKLALSPKLRRAGRRSVPSPVAPEARTQDVGEGQGGGKFRRPTVVWVPPTPSPSPQGGGGPVGVCDEGLATVSSSSASRWPADTSIAPAGQVHRFRRVLSDPIDEPHWPAGFPMVPFDPSHHPLSVYGVLKDGYASGGGWVPDFDSWWSGLASDAEYDPALIFLVGSQGATPAMAVAICWSSAFVKDIVVAAGLRRQGLASNLLRHAFRVFRARGANAVDLKVNRDNRGAISLYQSVGMTRVET